MSFENECKYWGRRIWRGIVSLGDFIEKWKIVHATGTLLLGLISTHDFIQTKAKHFHQHRADSLSVKCDSLKRKADSCTVQLINNRIYPK